MGVEELVQNYRCRILSGHVAVLKEDEAVSEEFSVLIGMIGMLNF